MFKTISAALLAVSVLAAPALAGSPGKTMHAPARAEQANAKFFNANARMGRHHHKHYRHHHRHHKHIGLLKTHTTPKVVIKHVPHGKRG